MNHIINVYIYAAFTKLESEWAGMGMGKNGNKECESK